MDLNGVQHVQARVCECTVSCRHVFLCRNRNKIKPSLVLTTRRVFVYAVFTIAGGCIESTFAAASPTVRLFIAAAQVPSA